MTYIKSKYKEEIYPEYQGQNCNNLPCLEDIVHNEKYYNILEEKPSCILPHEYIYKIQKCIYMRGCRNIKTNGFICVSEEKIKKRNYFLNELIEILENREEFIRQDGWRD